MAFEGSYDQLVRYLLHELPDADRRAIQESLFDDPVLQDRMQDAENDLIDAFARGDLSTAQEAKIREFVLATGQQDRLPFAAALAHAEGVSPRQAMSVVAAQPAARRFVSPTAVLAFACAALVVCTVMLWMQNRRLRYTPAAPAAAMAAPEGSVYTFAVWPGAVRGRETALRVRVPSGTAVVDIELPIELTLDYTDFSASLRTLSGAEVWSQKGKIAAGSGRVSVLVPKRALSRGHYEITLSGGSGADQREVIDYYYFSVE
jgi:hypothetical protein